MMDTDVRPTSAVQKHDELRSPKWPEFRDKFVVRFPRCACCGKTSSELSLQAHHVFPFHYCIALGRKELELSDSNLITLCETEAPEPSASHHLLLGHLDDFESSNLDVRQDVLAYQNQTAEQIRSSVAWQQKHNARLPHLEAMTRAEEAAFQWAMQETYPVPGATAFAKPSTKFPWLPRNLLAKL
jgi:hypothetical protein